MMELEPRLLMTSYHFDFGTSTSPCASGYTAVPIVAYNPQLGYGWSNTSGISAIDRGTGNNLTRAFQTGSNGTFEVSLPNGTYQVTPTLGDAAAIREVSDLYLEGRNVASNVTTQAGQFIQPAYGVKVTNGLLTVRLADNGGMTSGWALDGLDVVADTGPTASAGPNQTVKEDSPVNFTGLAGGFGPFQYQWQFGDGNSATGITPQHTYVAAGAYSVLFAVTDAYGLTAQSSMVVTVSNVPPSVALVGAPAVSGVGVPITLGSTVTDPNPAEMAAGFTYTWSVSENGSPLTSATGASPSFTFTPASQGTCVVNVTATAADGNTSPTSSAAIVVSVPTVALVRAPGGLRRRRAHHPGQYRDRSHSGRDGGRVHIHLVGEREWEPADVGDGRIAEFHVHACVPGDLRGERDRHGCGREHEPDQLGGDRGLGSHGGPDRRAHVDCP